MLVIRVESDKIVWMRRLMGVYACSICHNVVFSIRNVHALNLTIIQKGSSISLFFINARTISKQIQTFIFIIQETDIKKCCIINRALMSSHLST